MEQTQTILEPEANDLCDICHSSGVVVNHTHEDGKTVCTACAEHCACETEPGPWEDVTNELMSYGQVTVWHNETRECRVLADNIPQNAPASLWKAASAFAREYAAYLNAQEAK